MSDPADRSINEFAEVEERLRKEAEPLGLYLKGIVIMPPKDGGPTMIQGLFTVGEIMPERLLDEEAKRIEDEFNQIILGDKRAQGSELLDEARKNIESGKGLFGDDDD